MDTIKYLLLCAVLTAILVQGASVASIIDPKLYGSTAQNADNNGGVPACEFQSQNEFDGVSATVIDPYMFGSKVANADSDIGRMLYNFEYQPVLAYWDVGLIKGEFDAEDVVYIHINPNNNIIELDDIRLTRYDNHFPGSKVAVDDNDINKHLIGFPADSDIVFIDQYGSIGYDLLDPVYFHINSSTPQISRLDLRLSYFANGPAGTLVDGHDPDRGLPSTNLHYKLRFYNVNGNMGSNGKPLYDVPDLMYLDVSDEETHGFVVVNNIRLS